MVARSALIWLVLFALYLVLVGDVSMVEVSAGAVCATISALLALSLVRVAHRHFSFSVPPRALLRPLGALFPETVSVGAELLRASMNGARGQRGVFVRQSFDPGGADAASAGRRALAVVGVSLAPQGFAIRGDTSDVMILHCLPPKPASADARWPA